MSVVQQTRPHNTLPASVRCTLVKATWWCWTLQHATGCTTCSVTSKNNHSIKRNKDTVIVYQEAVIVYQDAVIVYQEAVTVYQDAVIVYQQAVIVYQDAVIVYQEAVTVCQEAVIVYQEAVIVYQDAVIVYHEAVTLTCLYGLPSSSFDINFIPCIQTMVNLSNSSSAKIAIIKY